MSRVDALLGTLLFAGALMLGTWYVPQVAASGGRPNFYQEMFGPAVMVACGDDYVNPQPGVDTDLDAFLAAQRAHRNWQQSSTRHSPRCNAPIGIYICRRA